MYQYFLFDLDGTLSDPGIGITNSVMYALRKYDIHVEDRSCLYKFIGPPLWESFSKNYGFSVEKSKQAVSFYREYFKDRGIYENELYDGTAQLLRSLKEKDKTVVLATSKPEPFALEILRYFQLSEFFDHVAGATMDESRSKKADVIRYALTISGVSDPQQAVMVGDREHDIFGAKKNGLDSIGVLYGYGSRSELQNAGATYLADSPLDVLKYAE